jgi:hypothetical protein
MLGTMIVTGAQSCSRVHKKDIVDMDQYNSTLFKELVQGEVTK